MRQLGNLGKSIFRITHIDEWESRGPRGVITGAARQRFVPWHLTGVQ
jgi:hypothetical protein